MNRRILQDCLRIAIRHNTPDLHPEYGNYHHFSFAIQDKKILEWGTNRTGEPPIKGYDWRAKIHSEVDCWRKVRGILNPRKSWAMVNIRLDKSKQMRISKPCPCCTQFLICMECSEVWFTTDIGFARVKL